MTDQAINQNDGVQTEPKTNEYWCNFCGYKTENLNDYLTHSCVGVIEAKGQTIAPTGQNECR
jgi:hypothetical protein